MEEGRRFALIVWEQTEEFKKFFDITQQKRKELLEIWYQKYGGGSYVGSVQPGMSEDGDPVVWINASSGSSDRWAGIIRRWSVEEALQSALKYGDTGWWSLDALAQLIEGTGPLLQSAMYDCGFRPHKRNANLWARIRSGEARAVEEEKEKWIVIRGKELQRLNQLRVAQNEWSGLNKTYSIQVNQRGVIYIHLEINPFSVTQTECLGQFGAMLSNRGHIAKQQEGFTLDARNVMLGKAKGVYIKAIKPDGPYVECIWPAQISQFKIYDLADDLVQKVKAL